MMEFKISAHGLERIISVLDRIASALEDNRRDHRRMGMH